MENFPAILNGPNPAGALGLYEPGDKFSAEISPTGKQILRQITNNGEDKKTVVVNKKRTVLYISLPNK